MAVINQSGAKRSTLGASSRMSMELSFEGKGGAENIKKMLVKIDALRQHLNSLDGPAFDLLKRRQIQYLLECCQAARKVVARYGCDTSSLLD